MSSGHDGRAHCTISQIAGTPEDEEDEKSRINQLKQSSWHADADFAIRKRSRIVNAMKKNAAAVTLGRKGGIKGGAA